MFNFIKRWGIIAIIPLFISACASTPDKPLTPEQYAAQFNEQPEFSIDTVSIKSIGFDSMTLHINASVNNHYPVNIQLTKINLKINSDAGLLYSGAIDLPMEIVKERNQDTSFEITLKYADLMQVEKDYTLQTEIECHFIGDAALIIPKVPQVPTLPQAMTVTYDDPHPITTVLPALTIKKFSVSKPSKQDIENAIKKSGQNVDILAMARIIEALASGNYDAAFQEISPEDLNLNFNAVLNVELQNKTKTEINFNNFNYQLTLNDESVIEGTTTDIKTLNNTSLLTINSQINSSDFTAAVIKAITGKSADYHLTGSADVYFVEDDETIPMAVDQQGSTKLQ